ncbi:MAG: hypothetical protein HYS13_08920 [Planctomycetia bacterium]|nr:hypothetical protein [Planctomycetia bacterium]
MTFCEDCFWANLGSAQWSVTELASNATTEAVKRHTAWNATRCARERKPPSEISERYIHDIVPKGRAKPQFFAVLEDVLKCRCKTKYRNMRVPGCACESEGDSTIPQGTVTTPIAPNEPATRLSQPVGRASDEAKAPIDHPTTSSPENEVQPLLAEAEKKSDADHYHEAARLAEDAVQCACASNDHKLERRARRKLVHFLRNLWATCPPHEKRDEYSRRAEAELGHLKKLGESADCLAVEGAWCALDDDPDQALQLAGSVGDAAGPRIRLEAMVYRLSALGRLGRLGDALALEHSVRKLLRARVSDEQKLSLQLIWLKTRGMANKLQESDVRAFDERVRRVASRRKSDGVDLDWLLRSTMDTLHPVLVREEMRALAGVLSDLLAYVAERAPSRSLAISILNALANSAQVRGDEERFATLASAFESACRKLSSDATADKVEALFARQTMTLTRIHWLLHDRKLQRMNQEERVAQFRDARAKVESALAEVPSLEGMDVHVGQDYRAGLSALLAEIEERLGNVERAARLYGEAARALGDERRDEDQEGPTRARHTAICKEADIRLMLGEVERAQELYAILEADAQASDKIKSHVRLKLQCVSVQRNLHEWLCSPEATAIEKDAASTLHTTVAKQHEWLASWLETWWDLEDKCLGAIIDMWGRGGFARVAAAVRGNPLHAITIDAFSVDEIRKAARVLCPLFETVVIKWKGDVQLAAGLLPFYVGKEPGLFAAFGGHGYVARPFERIKGYSDWCVAECIGAQVLPDEVALFLATEALALLKAGRLVVLPAPLVGCVQLAVGWTDKFLVSNLLNGAVSGVAESSAARGQRVVDLVSLAIPYIEDVPLSELGAVLEDAEEQVLPLRKVLMTKVFAANLCREEWAKVRALDDEIRDAFRLFDDRLSDFARKRDMNRQVLQGHIAAGSSDGAPEDGTDVTALLRAIAAAVPTEESPWLLYWRLQKFGGRLDWSAPLVHGVPMPGSATDDDEAPKGFFHWFHPGTFGTMALVPKKKD